MDNNLRGVPVEGFADKSREAAVEGIVLLKNENNTLPLTEQDKVSVFGRPMIEYYRSGTGSGGAVNVEYTTNILDGFENSNLNFNKTIVEDYKEWLKDHPFDNGGGGWACEPWFQKDMEITADYAKKQAESTNKAVYIIGRTAGEDKDNANWVGSYLLTDEEKENLKNITEAFEDVCVVLNVSNIIDLKWIDEEQFKGHIKSVIIVWQGGMEGGNAVAEALSGKATPSGKLPDTVAYDIEDYPANDNFGNELTNLYKEDIYVGYRYFETFAPEKVQFEFGFGLSYTTFDIETVSADADDEKITLEVKVTNTGDKFSGKEVVQVYYEAPQGALGQPARQLCAYEKTENLAPGQSQTLKIAFDINGIASYDDSGVTGNKSCYVLEAGDYNFYVGNSVKNNKLAYTYKVEELKVTEQLSEAACPNDENLTLIKPGKRREDGTYEIIYVPSQKPTVDMAKRIEDNLPKDMKITGDVGITLQDVKAGKNTIEEFVAQLTVAELAQIVRGEGMSNPRVTKGTASAFGGLSDTLFAYGIPAACCADGPSGLRMEGKATQLPIGTALSASWNPKLVRELYTMEGQELYGNQVDTLLGPGVNIHRHPLNGRNFEYYSEDPLVAGLTGGNEALGVQSNKGVGVTFKHFAGNDQENSRNSQNDVVSERAFREIYLKQFETAVKMSNPMGMMSTYGIVNSVPTANDYELLENILRTEWGFEGIVMTDWGGSGGMSDSQAMHSGNDLIMPGNSVTDNLIAYIGDVEPTIVRGDDGIATEGGFPSTIAHSMTFGTWIWNSVSTDWGDYKLDANGTAYEVVATEDSFNNTEIPKLVDNEIETVTVKEMIESLAEEGTASYETNDDGTVTITYMLSQASMDDGTHYAEDYKDHAIAVGTNMLGGEDYNTLSLADLQKASINMLNVLMKTTQFEELTGVEVGSYTAAIGDTETFVSVEK